MVGLAEMPLLVTLQTVQVREATLAPLACVRLIAGVGANVDVELAAMAAHLSAVGAMVELQRADVGRHWRRAKRSG